MSYGTNYNTYSLVINEINSIQLFNVFFSSGQALAQDVNHGILAYKKGNYAEALRNLLPIADIETDYIQLRISENFPTDTPLSQYYVGLMYCYGRGVKRNPYKASEWFSKARRGGNPLAENAKCKEQ